MRPDLVLLLGWMHLLSDGFVATFPELINLHPAFLPLDPQRDDVVFPDGAQTAAFRGAYAVRDALRPRRRGSARRCIALPTRPIAVRCWRASRCASSLRKKRRR